MRWDLTKADLKRREERKVEDKPVKRLTFKERCEIGRDWMRKEPWRLDVRILNPRLVYFGFYQFWRTHTGAWEFSGLENEKKIVARSIEEAYYLLVRRKDKAKWNESNRPICEPYSFRGKAKPSFVLEDEQLASLAAVSLGMGEQRFLPSNKYGHKPDMKEKLD
tara:strand:+ start:9061 stop:9552 length:492 start_codon:yes stop_codon:yes gene_type:complete